MVQTASPNRMELTAQKARLRTATRGHKLLKDKQDALTKIFLEKVHAVRELRIQTEKELREAYTYFMIARGVMDKASADMVFASSSAKINLDAGIQNTLGVRSPKFEYTNEGSLHEYGLVGTSGEVDSALEIFTSVVRKLIELAEIEKFIELLAAEIEKTRRRVNALEYNLIPRTQETIRFIMMKLDEMERSNLSRLMKIKDIVRKEN